MGNDLVKIAGDLPLVKEILEVALTLYFNFTINNNFNDKFEEHNS